MATAIQGTLGFHLPVLDDQTHLSNRLATFEFREGKWRLHANMPVSNETLVNGEVLEEGNLSELEPGVEIRLGAITLNVTTE